MFSRFEQFCTAVSMIHHSIQKIQRVEMARYGLKGPHAQCLLIINQYPEGITAARLCELCEKDKAAISRTVAELEEADMLIRRDPERFIVVDATRTPDVIGKEVAQKVLARLMEAE